MAVTCYCRHSIRRVGGIRRNGRGGSAFHTLQGSTQTLQRRLDIGKPARGEDEGDPGYSQWLEMETITIRAPVKTIG
ncbi:MAG: hypothetical protein ACREX4_17225 [Gammaproteobacteria bacterium]